MTCYIFYYCYCTVVAAFSAFYVALTLSLSPTPRDAAAHRVKPTRHPNNVRIVQVHNAAPRRQYLSRLVRSRRGAALWIVRSRRRSCPCYFRTWLTHASLCISSTLGYPTLPFQIEVHSSSLRRMVLITLALAVTSR